MNIPVWPALASNLTFPVPIVCERAIHGKVYGSGKDFDLIAVSPGFRSQRGALENRFARRDQSKGGIALWWPEGGRYYATYSYVGTSSDEAGRRGLETQILEWTATPAIPTAVAALAILSKIASLNTEPRGAATREITITLPAARVLEQVASQGIRVLGQLDDRALTDLYAALLARRSEPAYLSALAEPLAPVALAALLLPLDRATADACSLAGWSVERPTEWSVVVSPSMPLISNPPRPEGPMADLPVMMAASIRHCKPELAREPCTEVALILKFARGSGRTPEGANVPKKKVDISSAEDDLILQAAKEVLSLADSIPVYLQQQKDSSKVGEAYTDQMRAKADYVVAMGLLLHGPTNLDPWIKHRGRPNYVRRILEIWQNNGVDLAGERLQALPAATGSTLSSTP